MRLAITGAGSLGTIIGALMTKNGGDPVLIDINEDHVRTLNDRGATITGELDLTVPVRAITPDRMTGTYDVVLYAVKQYDNDKALEQLMPHIGPGSVVCTLQNGLPEEAVAQMVGRKRTVGCTVTWGATWMGPGVSRLTAPVYKMGFDTGELDGTVTERIESVAAILRLVCPTTITRNLAGIRWTKLLANAAYSGMGSVLGSTMGDVLRHPKALLCAAHVANEAISVSRTLGVAMEPIAGTDFTGLAFKNKEELAEALALHHAIWDPMAALKPSMLQDLEKGKRCEINAINGMVFAWGRKVKVPTPVNDWVVETVRGIEAGLYKPGFEHLEKITPPSIR